MQTPTKKPESAAGGNEEFSGDGSSSRIQADVLKYRMNYPKRGRFVIINNKTFKAIKAPKLEDRVGTDVDAKKLKELFETVLQFEVEVHNDLTTGQMEEVMLLEAERDHSDCDCFGIAVLTYEGEEGQENKLYGVDSKITIERLLAPIKTCESLYGKPKLCFVQACMQVKESQLEADDPSSNTSVQKLCLPMEADYLYAYSSVPGVYSWNVSDRGSWFIEALTDRLTRLAHEDMDLARILTRVINQVAQDMSPEIPLDVKMPSINSMLTKALYFTKKAASSI